LLGEEEEEEGEEEEGEEEEGEEEKGGEDGEVMIIVLLVHLL
jgi:hypothetical protein